MRVSLATLQTRAIVFAGCTLLWTACGGAQNPAQTSGDSKSTTESSTPEGKPTPAEPAATEPASSAAAASPTGPSCPFDTSATASTKGVGTVHISSGCVSPDAAMKVISQYFAQMHGCYTEELKRDRKAKGDLEIRINVGQNGTYSVRVIKSAISSDDFVRCLVGVLEPLPYPKPSFGGATIEFSTTLQ